MPKLSEVFVRKNRLNLTILLGLGHEKPGLILKCDNILFETSKTDFCMKKDQYSKKNLFGNL